VGYAQVVALSDVGVAGIWIEMPEVEVGWVVGGERGKGVGCKREGSVRGGEGIRVAVGERGWFDCGRGLGSCLI